MKPFSIKEVIHRSWRSVIEHWMLLLGVCAILFAFGFASSLSVKVVGEESVGGIVINLFSIAVSVLIQLGLYRIWINLARGNEARIDQMLGDYRLGFRYLGASIVYGLIVVVGLLLLIVPGIIWAIKYGMYGYAMVDRKLGVLDSLKLSAKITEGAKWNILGLWLALALLMVVSAIPLGLGLIVTIPMSMIITGIVYDMLLVRSEQGGTPDATPSTPANDTPAPFVPLT